MGESRAPIPAVLPVNLSLPIEIRSDPRFDKPLETNVREAKLLDAPWVRTLGKLAMDVTTEGWKFPAPPLEGLPRKPRAFPVHEQQPSPNNGQASKKSATRLRPPSDTVVFKERLLYLLQPSLESIFAGR